MKVISLTCLILSSFALANIPNGVFQGGGEWKQDNETKGTWTETSSISEKKGGIDVTSTTTVYFKGQIVHQKTSEVSLAFRKDGFFDVSQNEQNIGSGYCFARVCHLDLENSEGKTEETVFVDKNSIKKMGSYRFTFEGKKIQVAWRGALKGKP